MIVTSRDTGSERAGWVQRAPSVVHACDFCNEQSKAVADGDGSDEVVLGLLGREHEHGKDQLGRQELDETVLEQNTRPERPPTK